MRRLLRLLVVLLLISCDRSREQAEKVDVYPRRIPVGSPDGWISLIGRFPSAAAITVQGNSVQSYLLDGHHMFGTIPRTLLQTPGRLTVSVIDSARNPIAPPSAIDVFNPTHNVQFSINVSKDTFTATEPFTVALTITNRSSDTLYLPKRIVPLVSEDPLMPYFIQIKPPGFDVFLVPNRVQVTSGIRGGENVENYVAAGLLVKLDSGEVYRQTLSFTFSELSKGLPLRREGPEPGEYIFRVFYAGVEISIRTPPRSYILDEPMYSNEFQLKIVNSP